MLDRDPGETQISTAPNHSAVLHARTFNRCRNSLCASAHSKQKRRPESRRLCGVVSLALAAIAHGLDVFPIDQVVEERLEIFGPQVAIVDVVAVLPHVTTENRL